MEKLLTVIVPTYNMEMYLDKCLTSLIVGEPDCELMQKLEVLVINDGSTDRSSEIAHGYESRYPHTFKVVDKSNGNYGSCINVALPIATGKYVKILDADDWFDTDVFKEYLTWLQDKDVDAVFTDYCRECNGVKTLKRLLDVEPYTVLSFDDYLSKNHSLLMYGVTFNLKIFEGLEYHQTEKIYYTDIEWVFLPMSVVKNFVYYPKALYCYLLGRSGQTMDPAVYKTNVSMRLELICSYVNLYDSCKKNDGKRNGIPVNMDFLFQLSLFRAVELYTFILLNLKQRCVVELLRTVDEEIRKKSPYLYEEMNLAKYPNWEIPNRHLSFQIIRTWRNYGMIAVKVQLWLVNHFLGLYSRWNKLKGFLKCRI